MFQKKNKSNKSNRGRFGIEEFRSRLRLEKYRAERSEIECCVLVLDFADCFKSNGGYNRERSLKNFCFNIHSILRKTDALGIHKSTTLLILLSDTTHLQGYAVYEKVRQHFLRWLEYADPDLTQNIIFRPKVSLLVFPERRVERLVPDRTHEDYRAEHLVDVFCDAAIDKTNPQYPGVFEAGLSAVAVYDYNILNFAFTDPSKFFLTLQKGAKRCLDVIGSLLLLLLIMPVLLAIVLLVKTTSRGPVIFRQVRLGMNGEPFIFYKFRTMTYQCDDRVHREYVTGLIQACRNENDTNKDKPMHKLSDDARITRVGRFLRIWSLDELPQLFNVLKGEMSLVGPRPALPYEVEKYQLWHRSRMSVPPGMTGLWQVKGRSQTTFNEMVRLDRQYIQEWSLWLDVKLLWQTFGAVISREGAL